MCFYAQFHREARDVQDLLQRIDKELSRRYNPQFKDAYQIEVLISDLDVSYVSPPPVQFLDPHA